MRKFAYLATTLALTGCLALTACNQQDDNQQATAQVQKLTRPANPNDTKAWNAYLVQLVQSHLDGMTAAQPYPYLVPAGDDDEAKAQYDRQLGNVQDTVARGVLPGNLLAFAGPNSGKTADLVTAAFKDAKPGSFKGVIVLFIGDQADQQRVEDAVKPTGATFRFVQM
ncbi:hypothetical protein QMK61_05690 [Fulvimonas sp. R45]|uniref:hypothetical protein n=1 Tax=Fulvimonas sp. R45 TaxID=3045937 RepID=UPI00265FE4CE|nr:hypothetical protein [Fulvimonas sp. R45]MDO1528323.1 hypothetical protein [Fulvimonas sp. R45]